MTKHGRKPITIDWDSFEKLCALHCTLEDISGWFDCSIETIQRQVKRRYRKPFAEVFKEKSARGRVSLRRAMFEKALGGNVPLLIWLSKQFLGFRDKLDTNANITAEIGEATPQVILTMPSNGREADANKAGEARLIILPDNGKSAREY